MRSACRHSKRFIPFYLAECLDKEQKALDNFEKIGRSNYTAVKIRSRMTALKATWERCLQGHAALLKAFPPDQRDAAYFKEKHIETHEETYQAALDYMSECLEELEPCPPVANLPERYMLFEIKPNT
ncbi:altronate hydrolase [Lasius niger]|uniref:Altronate hydrolase n=1 Tax=Lasius niger TaxID=67767 RepID=A0A0J7KJU1_LASNI|nr:altronate hydrolase [Lasius niger]